MSTRCRICVRALLSLGGAAYLTLHRRHYACGLRLAISAPDINGADAVSRLEGAIALISAIDPPARRQINKYVRHIVIWPGPYSAANKWGGIHLSAEYLMIARQARLAGTLVHETTHLRIARLGVPYHPPLRERIEKLCIREEAHFLRRVPGDGESLAREVEAELETDWWTDASHNRTITDAVDRGELPRWAAWLIRRR